MNVPCAYCRWQNCHPAWHFAGKPCGAFLGNQRLGFVTYDSRKTSSGSCHLCQSEVILGIITLSSLFNNLSTTAKHESYTVLYSWMSKLHLGIYIYQQKVNQINVSFKIRNIFLRILYGVVTKLIHSQAETNRLQLLCNYMKWDSVVSLNRLK